MKKILSNQITRVIIIGNSLHYISIMILDYSLIHTLKFHGDRVKGLVINLYLLTRRRLLSASLIYNIIQNNVYYSRTFFLGLQQDYK